MNFTTTRLTTHARTWLLISALSALLVVFGGMFFGSAGYVLFAGIAVAMNFALYWFSDRMAIKASRAYPVSQSDDPGLYAMVSEIATRAKVPMPRVFMIPSDQPNAFATGRNHKHAAVAVTEGIRKYMPDYQLRGVLAHEFAHIKNRDILVSSIAAMIGAVITMVAHVLQFSFLFGGGDDDDGPLGMVGALAMIILAPLAATLIQLAVSRQREYLADATAAHFMGESRPLVDALETLERGTDAIPMNVNPAMEALFIANPLRGVGMSAMFSTHPPMQERIRRLRELRLN